MAENKPPPKQSSSLGYSIHFEPDKPWKESPVPRCLKDYTTKPIPSRTQLLEKQEKAFRRRKFEEVARQERIQERQVSTVTFDKKVRPYLEQLQMSGAYNY
ncbi:uncharacterized protein LOC135339408 [Halichondria panicea]|uniref:uncharacterized protein LOC135339408 n=1 Tax=Halichondria panicea TaxID=6063 RepID=UPI00312B915A